MLVFIENFGHEYVENEILLYTFKASDGMEVSITNFGGIVTSIKTPNRKGKVEEIVMGFDRLQQYIDPHPYFGVIAGRYANRIGKASFTIDGVKYNLSANEGVNQLHGGVKGFDKKLWNSVLEHDDHSATLNLFYLSRDLEEGYPGNLLVNVTYRVFDNNALEINYQATTDKPTHVNLTNHSYFNLNGFKSDVRDHLLMIDANSYLPLCEDSVPTGEIKSVAGALYDFREPKTIGRDFQQLVIGYDNCFVLNSPSLDKPAAIVHDPLSGRMLEVYTTQPGVQLYTSHYLDGTLKGHNKTAYKQYYAFCLETQHFPDSPNKPNFPSTLLRPGEEYNYTTRFVFSIK